MLNLKQVQITLYGVQVALLCISAMKMRYNFICMHKLSSMIVYIHQQTDKETEHHVCILQLCVSINKLISTILNSSPYMWSTTLSNGVKFLFCYFISLSLSVILFILFCLNIYF